MCIHVRNQVLNNVVLPLHFWIRVAVDVPAVFPFRHYNDFFIRLRVINNVRLFAPVRVMAAVAVQQIKNRKAPGACAVVARQDDIEFYRRAVQVRGLKLHCLATGGIRCGSLQRPALSRHGTSKQQAAYACDSKSSHRWKSPLIGREANTKVASRKNWRSSRIFRELTINLPRNGDQSKKDEWLKHALDIRFISTTRFTSNRRSCGA